MPYIIIRGNLASYSHKYPWRVLVSGLKADDIEQLQKYPCGGYSDDSTIVYLVHPCVLLSACEILGYSVIASSSTSVKQDYNEYMWTMKKDFVVPEHHHHHQVTHSHQSTKSPTEATTIRENISNLSKETAQRNYHRVDSPE